MLGELYLPVGGSADSRAGLDFATALGFASVHDEEHLGMRCPPTRSRSRR